MPYSIAKRNEFLQLTFPTTGVTNSPEKLYLALCSNDPVADKGAFTELSGDTYARVLLKRKGETLPDYLSSISNGKISNEKQIVFNRAKTAWAQANGIGLFTAETGSSPFFYATLKNPVNTAENQIVTFDPGTFIVQFADTDVEIEAGADAN